MPYASAAQIIKSYGNDLDLFAKNIYLEDFNTIRVRTRMPYKPTIKNVIAKSSRSSKPKRRPDMMLHTETDGFGQ